MIVMKKETLYPAESSVYPGLYRPKPETQKFLDRIENKPCSTATVIPAGVDKQVDHIRIELTLPGLERQNIVIAGYGNLLSVILLSAASLAGNEVPGRKRHSRKTHSRNFILPGNADGEFGSATYKEGYLDIYIPTGAVLPYKPKSYRIMVY